MFKLNHKDNNLRKNITLYEHKFIVFNSIIKDKKIKSSLRWIILLKTKKTYNVDFITSIIHKSNFNFLLVPANFYFNPNWDFFFICLNEFCSFLITNERPISWVLSIFIIIVILIILY